MLYRLDAQQLEVLLDAWSEYQVTTPEEERVEDTNKELADFILANLTPVTSTY
jgi:hypothetical protein